MKRKRQFCIFVYLDDDKRTYNPGVIISDPKAEDELCKATCDLQDKGRNVRMFALPVVDDIKKLPPLGEFVEGPEGYTYDPSLRW